MNAPYIVRCDKCEGMRSAMLATEIGSMSGKEVDQHLKNAGLNPLALVERLLNLIKEK
jgi:thermostable 8-oxoguanine DNA glycosylase